MYSRRALVVNMTVEMRFSYLRFVYPVKDIFLTTGYTNGYGLLVAFVARFAVRLGDLRPHSITLSRSQT